MQDNWLVVQSRTRRELSARKVLQSLSIPVFVPCYEKRIYGEYANRLTVKTLFLNYFFVGREYDERKAEATKALGVFGKLTKIGEIDDDFVRSIADRIDGSGFIRLNDDLLAGDEVVITSVGPFNGRSGVLSRHLSDGQRVEILLEAVSGKFKVIVERNDVRPVGDLVLASA
jgi:hypothetical protein